MILINMPLHLSQDKPHRRRVDCGLQKSQWDLLFPPPPIESINKLVHIFLHVLMRHAMKGAQQKCFQVADDDMHQRQPVGDLVGWRDFRVVFMAFGNHPQAAERIGSNAGAGTESGTELFHRLGIDRIHHAGVHEAGALAVILHRKQHRFAPLCAASALSRALTSHIGIIQFDQSVQQIAAITVSHGGSELLQHQPCGSPFDADHLRQPKCGDAAFVGANQVNGGKPLGQRHPAAVEHGAGRDRGLTPAALALVQCATFDMVSLVMITSRAAEAVPAPANLFQQPSAGLLSGEFSGPFKITDFVLFHVNLYYIISMVYDMKLYFIQSRNSELNAEAY